jgi:class 3 adenylate cyclase/tetratricopeptide (TPR) repeat protein
VTVVFADLVGSTNRAEERDPEEVDAQLRAYHGRVRSELERFGGTVEKFIGDAVVALFGAPLAHEDDPERAVRAALAIRDWAREQEDLQLRVAVNTGEAFVTLGARPAEGEAMATGDVVNTASRLQSAAPVNGIFVGEQTFHATKRVIEYRGRDPVEARGKSKPVPVWEAIAARSRLGVDVSQESRASLVGRERERELLVAALERVRDGREPQLVTLVGVPGIGKSRLVYELFSFVRDDRDLIYWRQGRSLPYGEGVAFWAFAEMVKAHAGILETDPVAMAETKLHEAVEQVSAEDAAWVERSLRPLVGLPTDAGGGESREESFAAWRRLVEGMADRSPTVLVFEDLHWADEGLLDFVDHLVDWTSGVPLLCVCTARPELLERRPGWGGGKLNATTIALSPLSDAEIHQLLAGLAGGELPSAELVQFAGGNPLYAEEYARMLADRGLDQAHLPETVQGIIAARLDALPATEKTAIQNAAVLGKVFWSGSLAALDGGDRAGLERCLHALTRKEFVRRERRSSVGGEDEFAFRHVLVRDVAYGQIPRAERAEKHRRAAEWIESLSQGSDDLAEMLAHHYLSALEYADAAARVLLEEHARIALRAAADRAMALNAFPAAVRYYAAALELWPAGEPERADVLFGYGRAQWETEERGEQELTQARDLLLAKGEAETAAEAEILLGQADPGGRLEHFQRALELVERRPPSRVKTTALIRWATAQLFIGAYSTARAAAEQALGMAQELGLRDLEADALVTVAGARLNVSVDRSALADFLRAVEIAEEAGAPDAIFRSCANAADVSASHGGDLDRCFELQARGLQAARRFGIRTQVRFFEAERIIESYYRGHWDEAIAAADAFITAIEAGSHHIMESPARLSRGLVRLARGDVEGAGTDSAANLELGREVGDLQMLYPAFGQQAFTLLAQGKQAEATEIATEYLADRASRDPRGNVVFGTWGTGVVHLTWALLDLGFSDEFQGILLAHPAGFPWLETALLIVEGKLEAAAERLAEIGDRPDEAYARLRAAGKLVAEGSTDEAQPQLDAALAFYRSVGAARYVADAEELVIASA